MTGLVRPRARTVNSLAMQARAMRAEGVAAGRGPAVVAEQVGHHRGEAGGGHLPANAGHLGVMPGISLMTMTAGPEPVR